MIEIRNPLTGRLIARFCPLTWQATSRPVSRLRQHSDEATEDRRARAGEVGK